MVNFPGHRRRQLGIKKRDLNRQLVHGVILSTGQCAMAGGALAWTFRIPDLTSDSSVTSGKLLLSGSWVSSINETVFVSVQYLVKS